MRELVEKAAGTVKDMKISREKDLMNRFMLEIKKNDGGLGVYGIPAILASLEQKSLDILLLSEGIDMYRIEYTCTRCSNHAVLYRQNKDDMPCPKCGATMQATQSEDLVETFYRMAEESGTTVELISEESDEGKLLKKAFGGAAGILRYAAGATVPH